MAIDYTARWEPSDGSPVFTFTEPYTIEYWGDPDKLGYRIPTADAFADGEYSVPGTAEPRVIGIGGLLQAPDADTLQAYWDTLNAGVVGGVVGKLYKNADRYLTCQLSAVQRGRDDGLEYTDWQMLFRASDPMYQSTTLFTQALASGGGSTAITPGGTRRAIPGITLVVSAAPVGSTITVTSFLGGLATDSFMLAPTATGTVQVDCANGLCSRGGVDCTGEFSGSFLSGIGPGPGSISLTLAGGATLSSASAIYRQRFAGA